MHPVESSMKGCGVFSLFPCFTCCTQPPPPPPSAPPLPPPPSAPTAAVIKAVQQTHPAVWTVIIIGGLVATAALLCKRSHPNHSSPFFIPWLTRIYFFCARSLRSPSIQRLCRRSPIAVRAVPGRPPRAIRAESADAPRAVRAAAQRGAAAARLRAERDQWSPACAQACRAAIVAVHAAEDDVGRRVG